MTEIRFHEELYDGFAIDEAVKVYAPYAAIDLGRDGSHYVVKVSAKPETIEQGVTEADLGAELVNYALGQTIARRGAEAGPAPEKKES